MKLLKRYKFHIIISLILFVSIGLNILETKSASTLFNQNTSKSVNDKLLTKAKNIGERLTLPLADTTIELKIDRAETSTITVNNDTQQTSRKQVYFQVYATVKNTGSKTFSFNSNPVFGVSNDNFILLAKNSTSSESQAVVNIEGLAPNQNMNFMRASFDLKPGAESSGFFLFESEVQTIQIISNQTPYIWHTLKNGVNIQGRSISTSTPISNSSKTVNFQIIDQKTIDKENKSYNLIHFYIDNVSDSEILPFSFIPKYGITVPGEVYRSEVVDSSLLTEANFPTIDENTKLTAHTTGHYVIAFPKNVAFIFIQPPLTDNFTNLRITL